MDVTNNYFDVGKDVSSYPSVIISGKEFVQSETLTSARAAIADMAGALEDLLTAEQEHALRTGTVIGGGAVYCGNDVLTKHATEIAKALEQQPDKG
jgi:hypothetical protein